MIREELKELSTTPRDLRKFGLVVGGVFLALGGWFLYRQKGIWPYLLTPGALLVLFGAMAYFGAALTLPGIAGVILTIGVGIDSNVLIFERIREELKAGKTAVSAVVTSFSRVFITLVDTHLAALISATFLFLFGTGPVKGFAVTLVIGLAANVFTAVFVSRTLFDWTLNRSARGPVAGGRTAALIAGGAVGAAALVFVLSGSGGAKDPCSTSSSDVC